MGSCAKRGYTLVLQEQNKIPIKLDLIVNIIVKKPRHSYCYVCVFCLDLENNILRFIKYLLRSCSTSFFILFSVLGLPFRKGWIKSKINIMNALIKNLILFFVLILAAGCFKDEEMIQQNPANFIDPKEYLPLKVGNYWVLQTYTNFGVQPGSLRPVESIDSIYVEKDTIINGLSYSKVYSTKYELSHGQKTYVRSNTMGYFRDSGSKMVHSSGSLYFSTDTLHRAIYQKEEHNNKTIFTITGGGKYVTNLNLPIGNKDALKWEIAHFTDKSISPTGSDEYREDGSAYFIKGIGFGKIIINADLYPSNNVRFEKHLIRYSIQ
jgi:hypothetical protein